MKCRGAVSLTILLLTPNTCEKDSPRWRHSCGDPVCIGYTVKPGVPLCTNESLGNRCPAEGLTCDPRDDCNRLLVCSVEEPGLVPCPDLP